MDKIGKKFIKDFLRLGIYGLINGGISIGMF